MSNLKTLCRRLFTIYRRIKKALDLQLLQEDLEALEKWAETWGMRFNATKCYVMSLHRQQKPLTKFYQLNGEILQQVSDNPYLGLIIRDDLQWSSHINKMCAKASQSLGFIRRNLRHCNASFKETAYIWPIPWRTSLDLLLKSNFGQKWNRMKCIMLYIIWKLMISPNRKCKKEG